MRVGDAGISGVGRAAVVAARSATGLSVHASPARRAEHATTEQVRTRHGLWRAEQDAVRTPAACDGAETAASSSSEAAHARIRAQTSWSATSPLLSDLQATSQPTRLV